MSIPHFVAHCHLTLNTASQKMQQRGEEGKPAHLCIKNVSDLSKVAQNHTSAYKSSYLPMGQSRIQPLVSISLKYVFTLSES